MVNESLDTTFESIRKLVHLELDKLQKAWFRSLTFPEPLETQFRAYYHLENIFYTFFAISLAILLLMTAIIIEFLLARENAVIIGGLRVGLIAYLSIGWLFFTKYRTQLSFNILVISSLTLCSLILNVASFLEYGAFKYIYYCHTNFTFFVGFLLVRLLITWAIPMGLAYMTFFLIFISFDTSLALESRTALIFFNFIGLVCAYSIAYLMERAVRTQFLQSQLLGMQQVDLHRSNAKLKTLSELDALTQISNRRGFDNRLEIEWNRARRRALPVALILFDVDYFKQYNDTYGHDFGDKCLQTIAATIDTQFSRSADLFARYGGEEFVVLLPDENVDSAMIAAERARKRVHDLKIPHIASGIAKHVTISCGVAVVIPTANNSTNDLLQQADHALYVSKHNGRNQCASFSDQPYPFQASSPH